MTRRRLLLAGVGLAAAAAGFGWAVHRTSARSAPGDARDGPSRTDLWSLRFDKPDGGEVVLATLRGQPLILNFWATWCPPCVEEMPLLDRFQREHGAKGWRVLGLAADTAESVRAFLKAHPVSFAIGLAGFEGLSLSRSLGNAGGALPFSAAFDATGKSIGQKLGTLTSNELTTWAKQLG